MKTALAVCCFVILMNIHCCSPVSGPHVADVNILLPPMMTDVVEYRLRGSDGCFQWSCDHHAILSVIPEYDSSSICSTSSRIRSIAPYSGRKETAVYATDEYTGIIIRCRVFIDIFSKIQIFHNSVKLDLEGLSTLRVRAFDAEDNVFSSLVGLRFMWKLIPEYGNSNHLTHTPLKHSPLSDCGGFCGDLNVQIKLEETGLFSDIYVVKGVAVGREIISVHLLEPNAEHIKDQIVVTVAEAISLSPPSPLFVFIGAVFQLGLKVIRGNTGQGVTLPSPFYRWTVSNTSVAHVDGEIGTVRAMNRGMATVTVEDTRVIGHVQVLFLYVVVPDTLVLHMFPVHPQIEEVNDIISGSIWHIVSGRKYVVYAKVFVQGQNSQEIYMTENDDVKFHHGADILCKSPVSYDDGVSPKGYKKYCILEPTSYGLGILAASLTYYCALNPERKERMEILQEIMVCEQVRVNIGYQGSVSGTLTLPWAPGIHQELELSATGGCANSTSDYQWVSSHFDTVSVSEMGVVRVNNPGKVVVRVSSAFDLLNYDEVTVDASFPSTLVMKQDIPSEIVVGSYLPVSVTLTAPNDEKYYKCDAFSPFIQWKVGDRSFVIDITNEPVTDSPENEELRPSPCGPTCARARLFASRHGQSVLQAMLSNDNEAHTPFLLSASLSIASFLPLQVHQVGNGNRFGGYGLDQNPEEAASLLKSIVDLSLVPGSRIDLILVGGPEPREGVKNAYSVDVLNPNGDHHKDLNGVRLVSADEDGLYEVSCEIPGSFRVVFKRGNVMKGDGCAVPSGASVEIMISCTLPSAIVLLADKLVITQDAISMADHSDRDPGRIRVSGITVANGRTIRMAAAGVDGSGKAFANSSTLDLSWSLNSCDGVAHWDNNVVNNDSSWEKFLVLKNESGECVVRATVVKFHSGSCHSSRVENSVHGLTDAIRLNLVAALIIKPESKLMLFNPNAKVNMTIIGGSCYLESAVNDTSIVEIVQPPSFSQCSHFILSPRRVGTASVILHDSVISPPSSATASVRVAEVDWIEIVPREDITVMEGGRFSFDLSAGINDGEIFDYDQFAYMDISVHTDGDTIEVYSNGDRPISGEIYINAPNFLITAKRSGFTYVYVSVKKKHGRDVLSEFVKIEIYPPPRIHPDYIFLVPGAYYMLTMEGGPTIGVHFEYSSLDGEIAAVDKISGLITAILPGNTTLVATFYGNGGAVLSRAFARIRVGIPSSVKLTVQSELLGVGHGLPVYSSLPEGDLFSFYQLCKDYKWDIEDDKVLCFHGSSLQVDADGSKSSGAYKRPGFVSVVFGRSAGKTNITLSFSCGFISAGMLMKTRSYRASISIKVIASLPLSLGAPMTWVLPPYYTSSSLLPSSPPTHGPGSGIRNGTVSYMVLRCHGPNDERGEGGDDGISIVGDKIRTAGSDRLACIQGTDRATGRAEIAACVRVSKVDQVRITGPAFPLHSLHLPIGVELKLPITSHDALGVAFHEAYNVSAFVAVTNYPDIVSVEIALDSKYAYIKALKCGQALVKVSILDSPQKSEFMLISVGPSPVPHSPVLCLGSSVNFGYEGLEGEALGQWSSSSGSIMSVNASIGEAIAVGEGSTQVTFVDSSTEIRTRITNEGVDNNQHSIGVYPPKEALITNTPFSSSGYRFLVTFSDSVNVIDNGTILHDCDVNPPYIGYAKPHREVSKGESYCLFFPYSPDHLLRFASGFTSTDTEVSFSIMVSIRGVSNVTGSTSALFVPGFSVLKMDTELLWLNFSRDHEMAVITVVGNTDVKLNWSNPELMAVRPIHKDGFGICGKTLFRVEVIRRKKFRDRLSFLLPANGQSVEIAVNYEPGEGGAWLRAEDKVRPWTVAVLCVTVSVVAMIGCVRRINWPRKSEPSNFSFGPTSGSVGQTTAIGTAPRTPPPFVEYVRQTLDETPFYMRSGGRRGFDLHRSM